MIFHKKNIDNAYYVKYYKIKYYNLKQTTSHLNDTRTAAQNFGASMIFFMFLKEVSYAHWGQKYNNITLNSRFIFLCEI